MALPTRRNFLRGAITSLAGAAGCCVYARTIEPGWLDVVRLDVPLARLPDAFADFTIAQISDLHFGPLIQSSHIEPVVQAVQKLGADAIVITGDLVTTVVNGELDMVVETLSRLQARQGVFAILGNHDWWINGLGIAAALSRAGVTVLSNEHQTWHRDGATLYLAGVDDVWCGKSDLAATLRGVPANAAVVALVHEPDFADVVANDPRVALQLSGHSHGGQIRVPFHGGLWFPPWAIKYPLGLYEIGDLTLYTNRGVGLVGWPIRFACRPEISLFTLKPKL